MAQKQLWNDNWSFVELPASPSWVIHSSVFKVMLLWTSPDLTQGIVPPSQNSLVVREGVEPDLVFLQ